MVISNRWLTIWTQIIVAEVVALSQIKGILQIFEYFGLLSCIIEH